MQALILKIFTIFPDMFPGFLGYSLTGRALEEGIWTIETVNIRDYAFDKHGSVDDTPCGGGAGMIMRPDVLGRALKANCSGEKILVMSPKGKPLTQEMVRDYAKCDQISIVCGRFEGIDERVIEAYDMEEVSIGDYVLVNISAEQVKATIVDADGDKVELD